VRRPLATLLVCLISLATVSQAAALGPPPVVDANAALVASGSGQILYRRNGDERLPMASITKLMTALVALDLSRPKRLLTVHPAAAGVGGSSIYLQTGEQLTVRDLLAAALIQSANDAAVALAAGTTNGNLVRFVKRMNRKAHAMGLENTHFANPEGLDAPGHYSSAEDILALARRAMSRPAVRKLVKKRGARIAGGRSLFSWNDLLGAYPGLFGVKTGHTGNAGWCQVAVARRDGSVVYAVILGSPTRSIRNADLAELLTYGLDHFGRLSLVSTGRTYATASIPFEEKRLELVAGRARSRVVRVDRPLVERVVAPAAVDAPVESGDRLGEILISQDGKVVARVPLVAAHEVEEPGFRRRLDWYAGRALDEAGDLLGAVLPGF
jgi:serine-type D-Ala-D-Ala carboxypeptidase (penicillin-binding protein 5/6)